MASLDEDMVPLDADDLSTIPDLLTSHVPSGPPPTQPQPRVHIPRGKKHANDKSNLVGDPTTATTTTTTTTSTSIPTSTSTTVPLQQPRDDEPYAEAPILPSESMMSHRLQTAPAAGRKDLDSRSRSAMRGDTRPPFAPPTSTRTSKPLSSPGQSPDSFPNPNPKARPKANLDPLDPVPTPAPILQQSENEAYAGAMKSLTPTPPLSQRDKPKSTFGSSATLPLGASARPDAGMTGTSTSTSPPSKVVPPGRAPDSISDPIPNPMAKAKANPNSPKLVPTPPIQPPTSKTDTETIMTSKSSTLPPSQQDKPAEPTSSRTPYQGSKYPATTSSSSAQFSALATTTGQSPPTKIVATPKTAVPIPQPQPQPQPMPNPNPISTPPPIQQSEGVLEKKTTNPVTSSKSLVTSPSVFQHPGIATTTNPSPPIKSSPSTSRAIPESVPSLPTPILTFTSTSALNLTELNPKSSPDSHTEDIRLTPPPPPIQQLDDESDAKKVVIQTTSRPEFKLPLSQREKQEPTSGRSPYPTSKSLATPSSSFARPAAAALASTITTSSQSPPNEPTSSSLPLNSPPNPISNPDGVDVDEFDAISHGSIVKDKADISKEQLVQPPPNPPHIPSPPPAPKPTPAPNPSPARIPAPFSRIPAPVPVPLRIRTLLRTHN